MLHIILLILKIIGIILLCILGIVLLMMATVLFVPVRYKIDFSIYEYGSIRCKVSWLLHIFSFGAGYGKKANEKPGFYKSLKIFGIDFLKIRKKRKSNDTIQEDTFDTINDKQPVKKEKKLDDYSIEFQNFDRIEEDDKNINKQPDSEENENAGEDETEQVHFKHKKQNIIKRVLSKIKKIRFKIKSVCGKIKKLSATVGNIKDFLQLDETKESIEFIKNQVDILFRHIRPKKVKGNIRFGIGDPAYTAEILGLYYLVSKGKYKDMYITPDFDNIVLEGEIHIKGRVIIFSLILMALKIYKNKNLRKTIEDGKSLKEEL